MISTPRWMWPGVFAVVVFALAAGCGREPAAQPGSQDQAAKADASVRPDLSATVSAAQASPRVPVIHWAPCGDEFPGADCGMAEVPLDYDRPRGETIQIALARIPAADQAHKIGTLFINNGGPGGSGVDWALAYGNLDWWRYVFGPATDDRLDIIGFDPRGVARSAPIYCFDTLDEENAYLWSNPQWWTYPYLKEQERPYFDFNQGFTARCLGRHQHITPHLSTANVARDLDLLRQAVGDERLTYHGISYGTYLGQTYANLFPGRIRAMVLDGVLDPRAYASGWNILYWATSTDRSFQEYLRICDEAGMDSAGDYYCPLSGPSGAAARWNFLLESARREPLALPDGQVLGYDALIVAGRMAIYSPYSWTGPDGWTTYFAYLVDFAATRDAAAGARVVETRQALRARLAGGATEQEQYGNGTDASTAIICADTEYPSSLAALSLVGDWVASRSTFGASWWWSWATPCATWPADPDRYAGPWNARTSAPVLFVGNLFDGVTDYSAAVASSKLLKGSRLLTYAGFGHTAISNDNSGCSLGHVGRYLLDGTLPAIGTVCPAAPNPYLPQPMLRAAAPVRLPILRPPMRLWPQ